MNYLSPAATKARAKLYWQRLLEAVPVAGHWIGLDFGCGQGYVVKEMARRMKLVYGIDLSAEMVAFARRVTAGFPNAYIQEMSKPPVEFHKPLFDLVSVHSVIHYMSDEQLWPWVKWWIGSLSDHGLVVIANVPPRGDRRLRNFWESLKFGWRERCVISELHSHFLMAGHGALTGHHHRDSGELLRQLSYLGVKGRILPCNLEVHTKRYSLIIERTRAS